MKIIKDKKLTIYYYVDLRDLLTKEKEFEDLKIQLDHCWETSYVRLCPRGKEDWYILLKDTGNIQEDEKTLNAALGRLGLEFNGELK